MSLLLDALRRAEEDSRRRKQGASQATPAQATDAAPVQAVGPDARPLAELTLQDHAPAGAAAPAPPDAAPTGEASPVSVLSTPFGPMDFPDLTLTVDVPPPAAPAATPAFDPRAPVQSYGRYARPQGAFDPAGVPPDTRPLDAAEPHAPVFPSPEAVPVRPLAGRLDLAAAIPLTTQRQALSAAGAMAGRWPAKADAQRRRQWWLGALALLIALPLVVFLLFGDAMFGSSGGLLAAAPTVTAPSPDSPVSPGPAPGDAAAVVEPDDAGDTASGPVAPAAEPVAIQVLASVPQAPYSQPARARAPTPALAASLVQGEQAVVVRPTVNRASSSRGAGRDAAGPAAPSAAQSQSSVARPASRMASAYQAYQGGNLAEAGRLYQEVLRADPTQSDAWLGLAVIAHANNQREPAMDAYKRVLRLEPQNATALAGLSSLITNAGEPQQESRLREMLARAPQEADLNNALGLVLSGERRWSEAQPLFFKAHSAAPQEPQFAYNLAVTLDHLRKPGLAAQYYETALGLAQGKASGFDEASARTRLASLRAGATAGPAR